MIKLKFVETHNPIFINGLNLQMKLDTSKRTTMELFYNRAEKELLIRVNGVSGIIPCSNVSIMIPEDPSALDLPTEASTPAAVQPKPAPQAPKGKVKAQASTPTSHVFEGSGNSEG